MCVTRPINPTADVMCRWYTCDDASMVHSCLMVCSALATMHTSGLSCLHLACDDVHERPQILLCYRQFLFACTCSCPALPCLNDWIYMYVLRGPMFSTYLAAPTSSNVLVCSSSYPLALTSYIVYVHYSTTWICAYIVYVYRHPIKTWIRKWLAV